MPIATIRRRYSFKELKHPNISKARNIEKLHFTDLLTNAPAMRCRKCSKQDSSPPFVNSLHQLKLSCAQSYLFSASAPNCRQFKS